MITADVLVSLLKIFKHGSDSFWKPTLSYNFQRH